MSVSIHEMYAMPTSTPWCRVSLGSAVGGYALELLRLEADQRDLRALSRQAARRLRSDPARGARDQHRLPGHRIASHWQSLTARQVWAERLAAYARVDLVEQGIL